MDALRHEADTLFGCERVHATDMRFRVQISIRRPSLSKRAA
jgi:hypothetical protein